MDAFRRENTIFLLLLTGIALWFCFDMVQPFLKAGFSAAFIAIGFYPLHEFMKRHVSGESRPALLSTLVVILVVILPTIFLASVVIQQGQGVYQRAVSFLSGGGADRAFEWVQRSPLGQFNLPIQSVEDIQGWLQENIERLSAAGLSVAKFLVGNVSAMLGNLLLTAFILFFCFRDGAWTFRQLASITPLTMEQVNRLSSTVHDTMRANVYGIVVVGLIQGLLTTIIFIALGLHSPAFWGVFAGFASILPPFGASIVWFPAAVGLMISGHLVKGIILIALGAGVISSSDNIVRPLVIQEKVSMGTLAVLISILGGIQAFGLIGLFAGPVIFCLTVELLKQLRESLTASKEPVRAV